MSDANRSGSNPKTTTEPSAVTLCDICGVEMFDRHCRLICPNCGYQRDCSDP